MANGILHLQTANLMLKARQEAGSATINDNHGRDTALKYIKKKNDSVAIKNTVATDKNDQTRRIFILFFLGFGVEFSVTISCIGTT